MTQTLTQVQHPHDIAYKQKRKAVLRELMHMSKQEVAEQLAYTALSPVNIKDESGKMSAKIWDEISNLPAAIPLLRQKGILDSTSGTTGNVLIRQDLEPLIYRLFIDEFPAWERLVKLPSNGLVHAYDQLTAPNTASQGSTFMSELGTVSYDRGNYVRGTAPIAVMGNGRGVSLKELAAVAQGGMNYNPRDLEEQNAITTLTSDAQWALMQGNATNAGGTASNEGGPYNALAFDGFRGVLGSYGAFAGNNAIQIDMSALNMLESLQAAAAKSRNAGGRPSLALLSINAKQLLDIEQQNNKWYMEDKTEIIPGVRANQFAYADGNVTIAPIPGSSFGSYNRTADNVLVEDMYVLDERNVKIRWLYSETFTVLQIPTGVDAMLSDRIIVFGMFGLQQAAPVFNAKVRRAL